MKKLIILVTALFSLSSCATVGVVNESAYQEVSINPNQCCGSIVFDVDPQELRMY